MNSSEQCCGACGAPVVVRWDCARGRFAGVSIFLMIDANGRRFFVFFGRLGESAGLGLCGLAGGVIGGDCHDEEMMSVG